MIIINYSSVSATRGLNLELHKCFLLILNNSRYKGVNCFLISEQRNRVVVTHKKLIKGKKKPQGRQRG